MRKKYLNNIIEKINNENVKRIFMAKAFHKKEKTGQNCIAKINGKGE